MRSRFLLATLLAAAALPAGAHAAVPQLYAAYDFHGTRDATFAASAQVGSTLGTVGTPTFADADVAGVVRPVGRAGEGSGFSANLTSTWTVGTSYTVALAIDVADEWIEQRILSLRGAASTTGLWMKDGRLEYRGQNGTARADADFPSDFANVVLTRDDAHVVRVYVDGAKRIETTDAAADASIASVRVGNVNVDGDGVLDAARLRVGKGVATDAEVAALRAYDTSGPVADTESPDVVDGVRYAGPGAQWRVLLSDDGDGPGLTVETRVETRDGTLVPGTSQTETSIRATWGGEQRFDRVNSSVFRDTLGTLADGVEYDMVVTATDRFGHAETTRLPFVADTRAPALDVDALPARVTSHTPSFSGAGGADRGDSDGVEIAICDGDGCADERRGGMVGDEVAWGSAEVIDGRWTTDPITMQDPETGEPLPLPDGRYTLVARQWDRAGNERVIERRFEIGPPLPVEEPREEQPQPPAPSVPAPPVPAPPAAPPAQTPRAVTPTPSALDAVVRALTAKGLKGLRKGVAVPASVRVLDASRKRVLASGTRTVKLTSAGRKAVRGKNRLVVVVRVGTQEKRLTLKG